MFSLMAFSAFNAHNATSRMSFYTNVRAEFIFQNTFVLQSFMVSYYGYENQDLLPSQFISADGKKLSQQLYQYVPSSNTGQVFGYYGSYTYYAPSSTPIGYANLLDLQKAFNLNLAPSGQSYYQIDWDLRSILLAVACNFGIIDPKEDLTMVASKSSPWYETEYGNFYIDSFIGAQDPIFCLNDKYNGPGETGVCFVVSTSTKSLFYPVLWSVTSPHYGYDFQRCACPVEASTTSLTENINYICNNELLASLNLVFWDDASNFDDPIAFGVKMKAYITASPQDGDSQIVDFLSKIMTNSYNSLISQLSQGSSYSQAYAADQTAYISSTAFPAICSDNKCSVFQFILYKYGPQPINEYNIELGDLTSSSWNSTDLDGNGNPLTYLQTSCTNTIYQTNAIAAFYHPPVALTQVCKIHATFRTYLIFIHNL